MEADPRFPQLGHVEWLEGPITVIYNTFLGEVKKKIESLVSVEEPEKSVAPKEWKVVVVFTHGDKNAGVTMHPDAEDTTLHWGRAYQWFVGFYSIGVRRLHFQTCFVGQKFLDLPVSAKANSDDTMIVTAWSDWLWLPDQEYLVESDDYIFRGIPLVRTMSQSTKRKAPASMVQIKVNAIGEIVRRELCKRQRE